MNLSASDSKLLHLWQSLQFEAESDVTGLSQKGDAFRGLLNQIDSLFTSDAVSSSGYQQLLQQYADKYGHLIDVQDSNKGLNNFAEPVLSLVKGHSNDSKTWKSSLSLETLKNTASWKDIELEHLHKTQRTSVQRNGNSLSSKPDPVIQNKPPAPLIQTNNKYKDISNNHSIHEQPIVKQHQSINVTAEEHNSSNKRKLNVVYPGEPSEPSSANIACNNMNPYNKSYSCTTTYGMSKPVDKTQNFNPSYNKGPFSSKDMYNSGMEQPGNKCSRKENENDAPATKPSKFITAKQQYIIDCKTKNQRGDASQSNKGSTTSGGGGGSSMYGGNSRKVLGTRRGPSSKFIPPIPRNDDDETVERKNGNKDSGGIDSELGPEVDERLKSIEPRMVELIMNEIMDHGPPITWDDIAGLEFAKTVIKEIVVWPMLRPDIFKGLRGPPKGLLLFGPPGTGKTLIGKCIASQSKSTFFSISASSLTSKWVGEGEKMVRALFAVARCYLPAVIFIDEIDSLLTQRTDGEHEASRRIKTEFLVQLDGATTNTDERLLVVGATNRPQEIDEAARRRLVKRLYIPLPNAGARHQIIHNLLSQQSYSLSDEDITTIVSHTEGYSGSDMSNLCREAAIGPIRCLATGDIEHITADQVRPIEFQDFDAALTQVRASVSDKDLNIYIEWNTLYGSGSK